MRANPFRVDVERPSQQKNLRLRAADLLTGIGERHQRRRIPRVDLERVGTGLERLAPLSFAGCLDQRRPPAADLHPREPSARLVIAVLMREVRQEVLQVDEVARVLDDTLRQQVAGVVAFPFFDALLGAVEHLLQPLSHGDRERREQGGGRFGWQMARHEIQIRPEQAFLATSILALGFRRTTI
jgi:hypothetical protein